jgi:hypothetical protein
MTRKNAVCAGGSGNGELGPGGTGAVTGTLWSGTNLGARHGITDLQSGFYANSFYKIDNFSVQQVPEPATLGLLVLGGLWLRRKN